ncbi:PKD domain-containing protein [Limibacter armeniacum]|uniref:PKD domain-containing protein n=1 Tax=Limibacter armeniacum TaxID=466084 RepID=UPI002FE50AF9
MTMIWAKICWLLLFITCGVFGAFAQQTQLSEFTLRNIYPSQLSGDELVLEYYCPDDAVLNYEIKDAETGAEVLGGVFSVCGGDHFQVFSLGPGLPSGQYIISLTDNENASMALFDKVATRGQPLEGYTPEIQLSSENFRPGRGIQFQTEFPEEVSGFLWDFGDGNISREQSPTHTYQYPGTYNVTLVLLGEDQIYTASKVTEITLK